MRLAQADTVQDLAGLVRECAAARTPLVDYGHAHQDLGNPPPPEHVRLVLRGDVQEHRPQGFTVRASAGATMGRLNEVLRAAGQFLPIDADEDMRVGEVIAADVFGPLRVGYGGIRDLLVDLKWVDGQGNPGSPAQGRAAGAGLEARQFLVGSLGELGVVYEATLRTRPVPEQVLAVDLRVDDPMRVDDLLPGWLSSGAAPQRLALALEDSHWVVRVAYCGRTSDVMAKLRSLETLLQNAPGFRIIGHGCVPHDQYAAERRAHRQWRRQAPALVRVNVPATSTGATCKDLVNLREHYGDLSIGAMPADGCIFAGGALNAEAVAALDQDLLELLDPLDGLRMWYRRPPGAEAVAPFAPPQPSWYALAQLKRRLDPARILNPGRFLADTED